MRRLRLYSVLFLVLVSRTTFASVDAGDHGAVVVVLGRTCESGILIEIDSKGVENANLLDDLGRLLRERGSDVPVFVLATSTVAIDDLHTIRAVAGKVGLTNVRFFDFDPVREIAAEIRLEMLGVPVKDLLAEVSQGK